MKKRILACLLALVMLIGLLPVTALAVDAGGTTVPMLDVSKSKTATALDANGQTQITLSLPSAEMKKTLDVVFVVDNAFSTENNTAAQQARGLVAQLENISSEGKLDINAGLVISGGFIPILHKISLAPIATTSDDIKKALDKSETDWKQQFGRKGSNIQAGIETAMDMLNGETEADDENKYLILISDGGAFAWYDKENDVAWSKFHSLASKEASQKSDFYRWCNPFDFQMRYQSSKNFTLGDFAELMKKSKTVVDANSIPRPDPNDWAPFNNGENQYQQAYCGDDIPNILAKYPNTCAYNASSTTLNPDYITSREAALYHTAKSIEAANKVNFIFVSFAYYPSNNALFGITESFKEYVAQYDHVTLYRVNGADSYPNGYEASDSVAVFENVKNDLVQLVAAGSRVEDTIGSNFELVSIDSLTVDGQPLDCEKTGDTYTFSSEGEANRFVVTYNAANKLLKWNINEEIKKSGVHFTYDEHGHPELGKVSKAHIFNEMLENKLKELKIKVKTRPVEIGYEVRCQTPIAYDLVYCSELGMGVYKLFSEGKTGCMVYISQEGYVSPLYLKDLQDPATGKIPPRLVDINSDKIQQVINNIMNYITPADYEAAKAYVPNPEAYDFKKILNW